MSRRVIFGLAAGAAVIGISAILLMRDDAKHYDSLPLEERQDYWAERIGQHGGTAAYEEFVEAVRTYPTQMRHLNAHFFGRALFDVEGPAGIVACDGRFIYGCFHAFTIRAVELGGFEAAQDMHRRCAESLGETAEQCEHGIGHGLLGSIGYGIQDLEHVLGICDSLGESGNPFGGCAGGAIMEYGNHGMQGIGFGTVRPFNAEERLEPCLSLSNDRHRLLCAYWLPMWWTEALAGKQSPEDLTQQMGRWCRELTSASLGHYRNCIAGIGNRIQLLTNEDPLKTASVCETLSEDPDMIFLCHKTSAIRFTTYYPLEFSLRACTGLRPEREERCRREATSSSEARRNDRSE